MKNDISQSVEKNPTEPETRVKKTVHRTFTQKFREVLRTSQTVQTEFKNAVQERIKRQIAVIRPNMSEDELNEIAADPDAAKELMEKTIMGQAHSKMKNTVSDIQEKYAAILKLEQSVNELFELFQELAQLVQAQGEMLDNIEANLVETENYLEKAETNLENAENIHK